VDGTVVARHSQRIILVDAARQWARSITELRLNRLGWLMWRLRRWNLASPLPAEMTAQRIRKEFPKAFRPLTAV